MEEEALPRFIVGMPRAGTTWLSQSLNLRPDVVALGETMFWGKSYVSRLRHLEGARRSLELMKLRLLAKPLETTIQIPGPGRTSVIRPDNLAEILSSGFSHLPSHATPTDLFLNVCRTFARAEGKTAWVEKTPHHIFSADRILRHLPDARFVAMIREPYSLMLSYKHQPGHDRTPESRRRFEDRYHPMACALLWRLTWRAIRRLLRRCPSQVLVVRMEEVEAEPQEVMRRVQDFLRLPPERSAPPLATRINSSFEGDSRPQLGDDDIAWMNIVAGRHIAEAGYHLRRPSHNLKHLSRSALEIPAWSVRFLLDRRAIMRRAPRPSER